MQECAHRRADQPRAFYRALVSTGLAVAVAGTLHIESAGTQTFRTPTGHVDNVRFERGAGGVVNVTYDLTSDDRGATFAVSVEVSLDGGQTFVRPKSVAGDVGASIPPGLGKRIVWDAGKDVETVQIEQVRFRVTLERGALRPVPIASGTLMIVTEPPGATVTVDGTPRGQTPVTVSDLSVGTHQVLLAKAGYLENRASVDINAGDAQHLTRSLTAMPDATARGQQVKSGGRARWLVPLAAGGAMGAFLATRAGGPPPAASLTISPDGRALVGITVMTFDAAPDPNPDTTYSWDFGDGASGSGAMTTHVYNGDGTFPIVLTVKNRGGTARATGTVTARSMTGLWRPDVHFAPCFSIRMTHTGSRVDAMATNGSAATVTLQAPRDISLFVAAAQPACGFIQFAGQIDPSLDSFSVPFGLGPNGMDTWRRQ